MDPRAEVNEMEVEDVSPLWVARDRAVTVQMERYLEKSEQIQVDISEVGAFLVWSRRCRYQHQVLGGKRQGRRRFQQVRVA